MEKVYNEKFTSRKTGRGNRFPSAKKKEVVTKDQVKSMIKSMVLARDVLEWNYFSVSANAQNVNFTGTTYPLTDVPQGDTDSQRGGDALSMIKLQVNYGFYASAQANACRLILYQWIPGLTAGSPPSATSLLLTTGSALSPYSPYNVDNHQQFHILYDKTHSLSPYEPLRLGEIKIDKFPIKSVQYTSGSASGSSKLFLLAISDDGVASYPTFSFVSKLYFIDA
jgi:hypothetical protein